MAEPLRIEDYVSPLPTPLELAETAPHGGASSAQSLIEDIRRSVAETERKASQTVQEVQLLVQAIKAAPPPNLDEIILQLREMEEETAARLVQAASALSESRKVLSESRNARLRMQSLTLIDRLRSSFDPGLEAFRDARWELMALRSELHRDLEQRVAFDGSRSLQELLGSLKP